MAIGPGKYDAEYTLIRVKMQAQGIILIVFGGVAGDGFEAQLTLEDAVRIPEILEDVAAQIRRDGPQA